ncbi:MAG: DNRLRE domain-containing protein [Halobacteria archaeon]|nr:DNRLRE domain-containing protein [Halobacteria archaeon]
MTRIAQQHGYILLPVVILITLVATTAFLLNNESALESGITASKLELKQAEQIARAGMEHATWGVQNSGCAGDIAMTTVPFGQAGTGSYTATVNTPGGATTGYPNLSPDQDSWFRSDDITNNNGSASSALHLRRESGILEYAVVRFDLASLPAGAQINSAVVRFYVDAGKGHPEGPVTVHRVTADWTETGATWETMATSYDSAILATILPQPQAGDVWVEVNLTAQVQAWVNGGEANYGIMMIPTGEGTHAEYISREGAASQQPHLDVIVGSGTASPVTITATGTLIGNPSPANDLKRKLKRNGYPAYQPASYSFLQLQPGSGKDAMLSGFYNSRNYGDYRLRVTSSSGSPRNSLVQFDLAAIPVGARVISAQLQLYHTITETPGADAGVSVHRVSRDWVEGTKSGAGTADGASWDTWNGTNAWSTAGGDYDPAAVASSAITDATGDWESWDITSLAQGWLDGTFANNGLLLKGIGTVAVSLASKEDADPTLHPKLNITYACECGSACLAPQGSGTVLMVVVNPTTLVSLDAYKKALFESWGYTVTVVGESANQATYDAAISAADVVFISETVNANQVGTKLADVTIAVVSQDGSYNNALGLASGSAWPVDSAINVTDTSHYITSVFPTGQLDIYSAAMEQLTVSGGEAPGLQTLADTGGAGSLVVLDTGAMGTGGTPLAGRRVMLPLGRDASFNWDYLNGNGRLLVQRALQWGTGNIGAPKPKLLFVSAGTVATTEEQLRIDLIDSWGYTVTLIDDNDSQANFDAAVSVNDVIYVSSTVSDAALGNKLKNAPIGVVNEQGQLVDEFGFGLQSVNYKTRNEIDVIDNTHYITELFTTGMLTIVSVDQTLHIMTANKGPGFDALAQVFNTGSLWDDSLGVIETGGELFGGGTAAGRRVLLPWGDATFDVTALNVDGLTLMQRAIEWAQGAGSGTAPTYNVLLVVGEAGALSSADAARKALVESWGYTVTVLDDTDSQANFDAAAAAADVAYVTESVVLAELDKKLKAASIGVVNEDPALHDVFGFSSARYLSTANSAMATDAAHYITQPFGGTTLPALFSSIQPLGAAVGTLPSGLEIIGTWSGGSMSSLGGLLVLDTGAAISGGGTADGRRVQLPWGGQDGVSVADINALTVDGRTILQRAIEWAAGEDSGGGSGGGDPPPADCDGTYRDEFGLQQYSQNDGTLTWATNWEETGETTDPTGGDIFIANDTSNYQLVVRDDGQTVMREADLSGAGSATLSFEYRRQNLSGSNDYVAVEVSYNGGTDWAELERFTGTATDTAYTSTSYVLDTLSLSANTRIRFRSPNSGMKDNNQVWFDNIQIQCSP